METFIIPGQNKTWCPVDRNVFHIPARFLVEAVKFLCALQFLCPTASFGQYTYNHYINIYISKMNYISMPESADTSCKAELRRARVDIKDEKKVLCIPVGLDYLNLRCKNELIREIKQHGYEVYWDSITENSVDGQTANCYCAEITKHNLETENSRFRRNLFEEADKRYADSILRNDMIMNTWHLDERPYIHGTRQEKEVLCF